MYQNEIQEYTVKNNKQQGIRRLWLVRHGLTEWNVQQRFCGHSDIPLSAEGRAQARSLAQHLREEAIVTIYTSDLLRARETAEIIACQHSRTPPVKPSSAWRELDFGAWEGLTYTEITRQFNEERDFFDHPEQHTPPNGEALSHLVQRVQQGLVELINGDDLPATGEVVLVSHGGPLRLLLCSVLGIAFERQWQFRLDPGSLSTLDLLPDTPSIIPQGILVLLNRQQFTHDTRFARYPGASEDARA